MQDPTHPQGVSELPGRKGTGSSVSAARRRKAEAAVQLRIAGATWSEIATTLGFPTPRAALVSVERTLAKQLQTTDRDKLRMLAGDRLDRLLRSVWPKAIDGESPEHLMAVGKAREIIDRHAKLFGLDAPTEIVVHSPTQSELEDWVARVTMTLAPQVADVDIFEGEVIEDEHEAIEA
jgi:hypothetical protein